MRAGTDNQGGGNRTQTGGMTHEERTPKYRQEAPPYNTGQLYNTKVTLSNWRYDICITSINTHTQGRHTLCVQFIQKLQKQENNSD